MEPRRSVSIFRPLMHVSPSQQRRDGSHLRQYGDDWQSWAHIGESWIAVSSTEHMSLIYECTSAERGVGVSLHACQAHHPLVSVRWDHWRSTYDSRLPFCLRSIFDRWFGVQGRVERLELHVCFGVVRCALVSYGTMDVYLPLLSNLTDACTFDFLRLRVHPPLGWWFPCRPGFPCSTGPDPSRTQDTSCSLDWVEGEDVGSPIFFFYPGWGFHPVHLWIDGWQMKTRSIVSRSWNHRFRFFLYACQSSMVSSSSSTTTLDGSHRSKSTDGSTLLILIVPTLFSKAASETTTPPGVWGWWCWVAWLGGMATEIDVTSTHGSPFKPPYPFVFVVSVSFSWFRWSGKGRQIDSTHTHTRTHTGWKRRWTTTTHRHHPSQQPLPHRSIVGKTHVDTSMDDRTYQHEQEKNTPWHPIPWKIHACGCAMDPRNKKHTGRYVLHADQTRCTRNKRSRRTKKRKEGDARGAQPCRSTNAKPNVDGWNGAGLHACAKPNSGRTRRRGSNAQHETRRGYHACERPRHETTRETRGGIDAYAWTSWKKETEPEKKNTTNKREKPCRRAETRTSWLTDDRITRMRSKRTHEQGVVVLPENVPLPLQEHAKPGKVCVMFYGPPRNKVRANCRKKNNEHTCDVGCEPLPTHADANACTRRPRTLLDSVEPASPT